MEASGRGQRDGSRGAEEVRGGDRGGERAREASASRYSPQHGAAAIRVSQLSIDRSVDGRKLARSTCKAAEP